MPKETPNAKESGPVDAENPEVDFKPPQKSSDTSLMPELDPAFPVTCLSMFCNFALSNILSSTLTIPASLILSISDAKKDYENWVRTKRLRERGVAEKFMPFKVKYDWSKYEHNMAPRFRMVDEVKPKKP
ncbi:hypothetical protein M3Y99_00061400 [Aphelenchoides fujianensis]|nr:hypothetical protein M3Y99_00061400 [Aphelenchoides fujianensis]